jgi:threonine dehydratase
MSNRWPRFAACAVNAWSAGGSGWSPEARVDRFDTAASDDEPQSVPEAPVTFDDVKAAAARLAGVAHRTPVLRSRHLDELTGGFLALKAESFQRIGAFKFRGAYNHLAALSAPDRARGVLTASSGNHSQAVALAARLLGVRAVVLMPEDAPASKVAATKGYGAEVHTFDRYRHDREQITSETASRLGLHVVHGYDDRLVIPGQGTVALELLEDTGGLDVLAIPVGGGGLLAGCAVATRALSPSCRIVGVEPADRPAAREARRLGHPVNVRVVPTIADGQQTASIGDRNWAVIARDVDDIVGVTDAEILVAMRYVFEYLKVVVEPSGASALAAILAGRVDAAGQRVGVILSGGNVDVARFTTLVSSR